MKTPLVLFLLLLSGASSLAQSDSLFYSLPDTGQTETSSTAPSLSVSASDQYSSESVRVVYGAVSTAYSGSVPITDPAGAGSARAESGASSTVYTITTASGASGTVRWTFHLTGQMSGGNEGQGNYFLSYEARVDNPSNTVIFGGGLNPDGLSGTQPSDHATFNTTHSFTSGQPFVVELRVASSANLSSTNSDATPPGGARGSVNVTLGTGGFSVVDENDQPLDYTAESRTGSARALTYPVGGAFNTFSLSNAAPGRFNTSMQLLGGTASASTQVTAAFVAPPTDNSIKPVSDVVDLAGTNSDPVVVKIDFDPSAAQTLFGSNYFSYLALAWFKNSTGQWKNAVLGNTGTTEPTFFNRGYNPATDFHLGYFGVDAANKYAWAVVNHNSQFVVTFPPPELAVKSVTRPAANTIHLNCLGEPARANRIETSPDLSANSWTTLATVTADGSGAFQYDDTNATGAKKFYRVAYP